MKRAHDDKDMISAEEGDDDDEEMMDIDEAKAEGGERGGAVDMDRTTTTTTTNNNNNNPFLDSFYGLSSTDPGQRATAAHTLLHYCLLDADTANTADAAYAFGRLLRALCSGRAAARQGNASALTAFLKLTTTTTTNKKQHGKVRLADIQKHEQQQQKQKQKQKQQSMKKNDDDHQKTINTAQLLPNLAYVRQRLLDATAPPQHNSRKKKGSEERDDRFGRLFGILAMIKSGLLSQQPQQPPSDHDHDHQDSTITALLASDLVMELYRYKKWMREPAAHALCLLLQAVVVDRARVMTTTTTTVILPQLLLAATTSSSSSSSNQDDTPRRRVDLLSSWSAEQLAVAMYIQSLLRQTHNDDDNEKLPFPLDQPVLSTTTLPHLTQALCQTSVVTQPRTHLVWDVLWEYISDEVASSSVDDDDNDDSSTAHAVMVVTRPDLLAALVPAVIVQGLLGGAQGNKTTHERRALALCLVRNLLGLEFVSSLATGRRQLQCDASLVEETVLAPILVQRLFIDVVGAGTGGSKHKKNQQAEHVLKPLAMQVLESLVVVATTTSSGRQEPMRLAVIRALLRCDARFDSRTKTNVVQSLLETNADQLDASFWNDYLSFLEHQVLRVGELSHYDTVGYLDLMLNLGKRFVRRRDTDASLDEKYSDNAITRRVLDFFLVTAFYDCQAVEAASTTKKKKRKQRVLEVALMIKTVRSSNSLPYEVRTVASARFFSLLSEQVARTVHSTETDKDAALLDLFTDVRKSCSAIKDAGVRHFGDADTESMDVDDEKDPTEVVEALNKRTLSMDDGKVQEKAKLRFNNGLAILASALHLHLLSCGLSDNTLEDDDPDADDDEDRDEIRSMLSDLWDISEETMERSDSVLPSMAEFCVNVLSSPLSMGNQSRGASPRILREVVKIAWIRALTLASTVENAELSLDVVEVLLSSVGAGVEPSDEEHDDSEDSDEDEESMDDENSGTFAQAARLPDDDSDEEKDDEESGPDDEDESDIELDPSRLQSLLEEDVDDSSIEEVPLEHHEGADAALAKLIQLKQDARKAGQKAREHLELTRQVRCTLLLEILASGKPEGWGVLLRVDTVVQICIALLRYRRELESAVTSASERSTERIGEKRAMLDRITTILEGKLLRMKVANMKWSAGIDVTSFTKETSVTLLRDARKRGSKNHRHLTSSAIFLLIRAPTSTSDKLQVAQVYGDAVEEWASKRTTHFESAFFDHLMHQAPVVAQASLPRALAAAAATARSSYIKSEAFRLLAQLYNPKLNANDTELEQASTTRISEAIATVLESVTLALKDGEMKKAKRIREVLKAAEKLVAFLADRDADPVEQQLEEIKVLLVQVGETAGSQGVSKTCEKVIQEIESLSTRRLEQNEGETRANSERKGSKSSKKKKKSKKKKR